MIWNSKKIMYFSRTELPPFDTSFDDPSSPYHHFINSPEYPHGYHLSRIRLGGGVIIWCYLSASTDVDVSSSHNCFLTDDINGYRFPVGIYDMIIVDSYQDVGSTSTIHLDEMDLKRMLAGVYAHPNITYNDFSALHLTEEIRLTPDDISVLRSGGQVYGFISVDSITTDMLKEPMLTYEDIAHELMTLRDNPAYHVSSISGYTLHGNSDAIKNLIIHDTSFLEQGKGVNLITDEAIKQLKATLNAMNNIDLTVEDIKQILLTKKRVKGVMVTTQQFNAFQALVMI